MAAEIPSLSQDTAAAGKGFADGPPPVGSPDAPVWMAAVQGNPCGPYRATDIARMLRDGGLSPEALLWRPGRQAWSAARAIEEFAPFLPQPQHASETKEAELPPDDGLASLPGASGGFVGDIFRFLALPFDPFRRMLLARTLYVGPWLALLASIGSTGILLRQMQQGMEGWRVAAASLGLAALLVVAACVASAAVFRFCRVDRTRIKDLILVSGVLALPCVPACLVGWLLSSLWAPALWLAILGPLAASQMLYQLFARAYRVSGFKAYVSSLFLVAAICWLTAAMGGRGVALLTEVGKPAPKKPTATEMENDFLVPVTDAKPVGQTSEDIGAGQSTAPKEAEPAQLVP